MSDYNLLNVRDTHDIFATRYQGKRGITDVSYIYDGRWGSDAPLSYGQDWDGVTDGCYLLGVWYVMFGPSGGDYAVWVDEIHAGISLVSWGSKDTWGGSTMGSSRGISVRAEHIDVAVYVQELGESGWTFSTSKDSFSGGQRVYKDTIYDDEDISLDYATIKDIPIEKHAVGLAIRLDIDTSGTTDGVFSEFSHYSVGASLTELHIDGGVPSALFVQGNQHSEPIQLAKGDQDAAGYDATQNPVRYQGTDGLQHLDLVDIDDSTASPLRVSTSSGIKSVRSFGKHRITRWNGTGGVSLAGEASYE